MSGLAWAALGVLSTLALTVIGDMVSEEVRDRLDHLPHAILRLASYRLGRERGHAMYEDEWLPELTYILTGDETRPLTRLYHGLSYALSMTLATRRIMRELPKQKKVAADFITAEALGLVHVEAHTVTTPQGQQYRRRAYTRTYPRTYPEQVERGPGHFE